MIAVFYSFKGGVGRSMAVANVADLLARRGLRVLMIDFDLEAPGLEQYFPINQSETRNHAGLLDLLLAYKQTVSLAATDEGPSFKEIERFILPVYKDLPAPAKLDLMSAGQRDGTVKLADYAQSLRTFDWQDFLSNWAGDRFFEWLRLRVVDLYDVVLVDSRTGVTEMGGICAYQLADAMLMFSGANRQNLKGTQNLVRNFALPGVQSLRHGRPLDVVVVPARIEQSDEKLLEDLRKRFAVAFGDTTPRVLQEAKLGFWDLKIPYEPHYAFEERVVTDPHRREAERPIAHAFREIVRCLALLAVDGSALARLRQAESATEASVAPAPIQYDPTRRLAGYDACILYHREDRSAVDALARQLEGDTGLRVWADWSTAPGTNWTTQLEEAVRSTSSIIVAVGDAGVTGLLLEEINFVFGALATRSDLHLIPVILPHTKTEMPQMPVRLRAFQLEDFRGRDSKEACQELANRIRMLRPAPAPAERPTVDYGDPYIGAQPFSEQQTLFFAGRDAVLQTLIKHVHGSSFTALTGPAGSGKSSLVHGGLFPALRQEAETSWTLDTLRMLEAGPDPAATLAQIFLPDEMMASVLSRNADVGNRSARIVSAIIESLESSPSDYSVTRRLLFVDQFEELAESEGRATFAQLLVALAERAGPRLAIVIAIRDDAIGALKNDELALAGLITSNQITLQPMSAEELQQAIEKPARQAGFTFEPGLVNRILSDFSADTRPLALLQMVLLDLYRQAREGFLTNEAYDRMGNLGGYLQRQAEEVFAQLSREEQGAALWILLRLVQPDASGGTTRRCARLNELRSSSLSDAAIRSALDRLMEGRLLIRSSVGGEQTVELANEALLRSWPRLQKAIEESRDDLLLRKEIETAQTAGPGRLRDDVIQRTTDVLRRSSTQQALSQDEIAYYETSRRLREWQRTALRIGAATAAGALVWAIAYYANTFTTPYQIKRVISDAPVAEAAMGVNAGDAGRDTGIHVAAHWVRLLRDAGETKDATRAFDLAHSAIAEIDYGSETKFSQATGLAVLAGATDAKNGARLLEEAEALLPEVEPAPVPKLPYSNVQQQQQQQVAVVPRSSFGDRDRQRQRAIGDVAYGWAVLGQNERAVAMLQRMSPGISKIAVASEIARRSTPEQRATLVPMITDELPLIADPRDRTLATLNWSRTLRDIGFGEQANALLNNLEEDIKRIEEPSTRITASISLILALSKIDPARAEALFKKSWNYAAALPDVDKLRCLSLLATGTSGAVPEASMTELLKMIVQLGERLPTTPDVDLLVKEARRRLGEQKEREHREPVTVTRSISEARQIADPVERTDALIRIGGDQWKSGNATAAKSTLDEALAVAEAMQNPAAPSGIFRQISRSYCVLGSYRRSRLTANRCTSPIDRLDAYSQIIAKYFSLKPAPE